MQPNRIVREDIERIAGAAIAWERFSGAAILITGASGFLPAYIVETLVFLNREVLSQPARVVALVRNRDNAAARFAELLERQEIELLVQDVCDPLPDSMRFDYVVHAASQASPKYYKVDPVGTLSANILGIRNLLTAAAAHPVQGLLYFSSGDVYGIMADNMRIVGEKDYGSLDCTDVRACYGESKRMAETMCVAWAHQFGVPAKIVRPFHTYGPGMRLDDGRVFADFVRDIISGGPIVLHSDGSARRCFCYLADATEAFFRVLLQGASGEAYNVANPQAELSIAELAQRLGQKFGVAVESRVRPNSNYLPSPIAAIHPAISKIESLGWSARTGIEEGFGRTVGSYGSAIH